MKLLGVLVFLCSVVYVGWANVWGAKTERSPLEFLPPNYENIERFSFGYQDNIADSLWLRLVQDYHYCGQQNLKKQGIEKGVDQSIFGPDRVMNCNKGWVYHMLKSILQLSPHFLGPARTGGIMLSVAVDDVHGATEVYDLAIKGFPHNWNILYSAAYHNLFETKDKDMAADLLVRAGRLGAPWWVFSLASEIYTEGGSIRVAYRTLLDLYADEKDRDPNSDLLKSLEVELEEVRKEASRKGVALPNLSAYGY